MRAAVLLVGGADAENPPPDDAAFAAFGLFVERPAPEPFLLWPENDIPVKVFQHMDTQWNAAPGGGVIGLRYEALPVAFETLRVARGARPDVMASVRVMERAAVEHINRKS